MDTAAYTILSDVGYATVAIAGVVLIGRLYIRWRSSALSWDDLFNSLAVVCLIGFAADPYPGDDPTNPAIWKNQVAESILLWTILYFVKASFLALCWNIFNVSATFRKAWSVVAVYTFLSYWALFLSNFWQCGAPYDYTNPPVCSAYISSPEGAKANVNIWILNIALHISSEMFILALPLCYISQLQMSRAQKLNAATVFCAVGFTIIIGILRNVSSLCTFACSGSANKWDWVAEITGVFEPSVAVIVCALPPYKVLLSKIQKRRGSSSSRLVENVARDSDQAPSEKKLRQDFRAPESVTELDRDSSI